jgi:hypothetical protein
MADRLYFTMAYCCLVIGTNCHEWLSYMFGKWYGRVVCCAGVESASNQPVFNASHGTGRFIVVDWRRWWLWIATCLTNIIYLLCNNLTMFIENDWRRRQFWRCFTRTTTQQSIGTPQVHYSSIMWRSFVFMVLGGFYHTLGWKACWLIVICSSELSIHPEPPSVSDALLISNGIAAPLF